MYFKFYIFISENSLEILWFSQVISRGTCHRHVTGHTTNVYKEQVKSRGTLKYFHLNFALVKIRTSHTIFNLWQYVGPDQNIYLGALVKLRIR